MITTTSTTNSIGVCTTAMNHNESQLICLQCRRTTTTNSSPSSPNTHNDARFSCRICLEGLKEPVVTKCGHLFCWPCLYEWLEPGIKPSERLLIFGVEGDRSIRPNASRRVCPACKMPCSVKNVVNIYVPDVEEEEDDQNQVSHTPRRLTPPPLPPTGSASSERNSAAAAVGTSHHNASISSSSNNASGMDRQEVVEAGSSHTFHAVPSSVARQSVAAATRPRRNHSSRPTSGETMATPTDVPRLVSFQTPDGASDSSSVPSNLSLFAPVRNDAASPLTEASHHRMVSPQRSLSGGFQSARYRDATFQRSPPSFASVASATATPFTPTGITFRSGQAFRRSLEDTTTTTTTNGGALGVPPQGIAFSVGSSSTLTTRKRRTVRTAPQAQTTTTATTEAPVVGGADVTVNSPMATYASNIFVFGAPPPVVSDESSPPAAVAVTPLQPFVPRNASVGTSATTSTCLDERFSNMLSLENHNESQNVAVPFAREWGLESDAFSVIGDNEQPQAHVTSPTEDAMTPRDAIRNLHNVTPELVLPSGVERHSDTTTTRAIFVFGESPETPLEAPFISSPFGNVGPMPPFVNPIQGSETICSPNCFERPRSSSGLTFSVGKHLGSSCKKPGRVVLCRKTSTRRVSVS